MSKEFITVNDAIEKLQAIKDSGNGHLVLGTPNSLILDIEFEDNEVTVLPEYY